MCIRDRTYIISSKRNILITKKYFPSHTNTTFSGLTTEMTLLHQLRRYSSRDNGKVEVIDVSSRHNELNWLILSTQWGKMVTEL